MVTISKKVEKGKLVSVHAKKKENILQIKITGDFFLFPEESILELERELSEIHINSSFDEIKKEIERIIQENKINIVGFKPEDLAEIIKEAATSLTES